MQPNRSLDAFRASTRRPSDFDGFWNEAHRDLDLVPDAVFVERSSLRSSDTIDVFEVRFSSIGGARVFGWLARGREARSRRPGLVIFPGYGGSPGIPRAWAKVGFVALQISPRGHHLSDDRIAPGFPGLMTSGIDEPRDYVYRGVYCDAWRAVDVLAGRDDVDRDRVGVTGGSQGGALAMIAAAGRTPVAAVAADVPFLTAIRDALSLGNSYPYEEVKDYLRVQPERRQAVLTTLDYIDTVNFADRVRASALLSVGLRDDICPPQTAYALFNALTCPKDIRVYAEGAHEGGGYTHAVAKEAWLRETLGATSDNP
ncbi:MAG: acetylxylan esterase [Chloroflexota bacterium]|nr:MAG: acetylxylan esterase [Chloroflexota bacterium]